MNTNPLEKTYTLHAIGQVHRTPQGVQVEVCEAYRAALKDLDGFSHIYVVWWAEMFDHPDYRAVLQCELPYVPGHTSGVFATRSPLRPNLVMFTVCKLLALDSEAGTLRIANLDAFDGTPVLDIKGYYPVCDRVQEARIPAYLEGWPDWLPEEGIGLEPGEE